MENQPATAHVSSGWRKILDHPYIYNFWQLIVGSESAKKRIISQYCRPHEQARILDMGCGTGSILNCIAEDLRVDYTGYDVNSIYIDFARKKHGHRGRFYSAEAIEPSTPAGSFDIVLGIGILHHLNEPESLKLIESAWDSLSSGGFLLSSEPIFTKAQSRLERYLMSKDRGHNILTEERHISLIRSQFTNITSHVVSDIINIPWTVSIIKAWKA